MIRPNSIYLLWCIALVITLSSCSDVQEYPVGPISLKTPERISDASLNYDPSSNSAVMSWTVPRVSDDAARLIRYEIRYIYDAKFEWARALSILNPPSPLPAGRKQQFSFKNPELGGVLRAAVVAIDDAGQMSEPSNVTTVQVPGLIFIGQVIDALSLLPIPGLELEVTSSTASVQITTDAGGEFQINDMRPQDITVSFENLAGQPRYFGLVKEFQILSDSYHQLFLIPYQMSDLYPSVSLLTLMRQACRTQVSPYELIRKWETLPMPVYIPEYINEHGVDYRQTAIDAVNGWINSTGIEMWELVEEPASWGVEMFFKPESEMGIHLGYTTHQNTPEGLPLRSDISIINAYPNTASLYRVMLHEFGHTIRLRHLPSGFLMYSGHPLPDTPKNEEIMIVQILNNLPNWTDMRIYHEVTP